MEVHGPSPAVTRRNRDRGHLTPVDTLQRLADFAGLAPSRVWDRSVRSLAFPNRNEAWRIKLDDDAVRTITDIQSDELRSHGYALER